MKGSSKVVGIIFLLLALIILIWLLGTQFVSTGQQVRSLPKETNIPDFSESSYVSTDDWIFAVGEAGVATNYVAESELQLQRLVALSQQTVLSAKQAGADVSQLEARTNTLIFSYNELKEVQSELVALNLRVETQKMAPQRSMEEEFTQKTDRIYTLMETITTEAEQIKKEGLIEKALEATEQKTTTTAPKTIEIPPEKETSSLPPVLKEEKTEVTTPKTVETSKDREAKKAQREAQREKTTGVLKGLTAWIKGFGETIRNFFGGLFGKVSTGTGDNLEDNGGFPVTLEGRGKGKKSCACYIDEIGSAQVTCLIKSQYCPSVQGRKCIQGGWKKDCAPEQQSFEPLVFGLPMDPCFEEKCKDNCQEAAAKLLPKPKDITKCVKDAKEQCKEDFIKYARDQGAKNIPKNVKEGDWIKAGTNAYTYEVLEERNEWNKNSKKPTGACV